MACVGQRLHRRGHAVQFVESRRRPPKLRRCPRRSDTAVAAELERRGKHAEDPLVDDEVVGGRTACAAATRSRVPSRRGASGREALNCIRTRCTNCPARHDADDGARSRCDHQEAIARTLPEVMGDWRTPSSTRLWRRSSAAATYYAAKPFMLDELFSAASRRSGAIVWKIVNACADSSGVTASAWSRWPWPEPWPGAVRYRTTPPKPDPPADDRFGFIRRRLLAGTLSSLALSTGRAFDSERAVTVAGATALGVRPPACGRYRASSRTPTRVCRRGSGLRHVAVRRDDRRLHRPPRHLFRRLRRGVAGPKRLGCGRRQWWLLRAPWCTRLRAWSVLPLSAPRPPCGRSRGREEDCSN